MQLLTIITVGLSALSYVAAAPQGGFPGGFGGSRGPTRGRIGDDFNNFGRIGGSGRAGSDAGSSLKNNGNNNGGNAGSIAGSPNSEVNQSSTSCANGQIVCCNGPTTNTASSNSGRQNSRALTKYQFLLDDLFRNNINIPTVNRNRESNESNQCNQVTTWEAGSASPICQQTVACCSGNQGPAVANVGCTAMNIVVNTGSTPSINGFFPKEKE